MRHSLFQMKPLKLGRSATQSTEDPSKNVRPDWPTASQISMRLLPGFLCSLPGQIQATRFSRRYISLAVPHTAFDPGSAISTTSDLGTLAAIAQAQAAEAREWKGGAEVVDTKTDVIYRKSINASSFWPALSVASTRLTHSDVAYRKLRSSSLSPSD
jgi:hypothetical protein